MVFVTVVVAAVGTVTAAAVVAIKAIQIRVTGTFILIGVGVFSGHSAVVHHGGVFVVFAQINFDRDVDAVSRQLRGNFAVVLVEERKVVHFHNL